MKTSLFTLLIALGLQVTACAQVPGDGYKFPDLKDSNSSFLALDNKTNSRITELTEMTWYKVKGQEIFHHNNFALNAEFIIMLAPDMSDSFAGITYNGSEMVVSRDAIIAKDDMYIYEFRDENNKLNARIITLIRVDEKVAAYSFQLFN